MTRRITEDPAMEIDHDDLRAVARYAATCARWALPIVEQARPEDRRPRAAIEAAQGFAHGAERTKAIRDAAWAAMRASGEARDAGEPAAAEAARAAMLAASAPYLHPIARATQVEHILGPAAHAARALELCAGGDVTVGAVYVEKARALADRRVVDVLGRYPAAPPGGGRVAQLVRDLDSSLR